MSNTYRSKVHFFAVPDIMKILAARYLKSELNQDKIRIKWHGRTYCVGHQWNDSKNTSWNVVTLFDERWFIPIHAAVKLLHLVLTYYEPNVSLKKSFLFNSFSLFPFPFSCSFLFFISYRLFIIFSFVFSFFFLFSLFLFPISFNFPFSFSPSTLFCSSFGLFFLSFEWKCVNHLQQADPDQFCIIASAIQ